MSEDRAQNLLLPEQLILLAAQNSRRPWALRAHLAAAVAAAELVELERRGRIRLDGGRVVVAGEGPTGVPELDQALERLAPAGRELAEYLQWEGGAAQRRYLDRLVEQGRLERRLSKALVLTRSTDKDELVDALRDAGSTSGAAVLPLAALTDAAGLLDRLVPGTQVEALRARYGELHRELVRAVAQGEDETARAVALIVGSVGGA